MAVTKGRYQTRENIHEFWSFSVVDTEGQTLGTRFMCACKDEEKASLIASALNFNLKPSEYGFELVK